MKTVRSMMRFNPDMPGAIELVHPNKFLPNLRPIEDFRHTPIIPISEKDILATPEDEVFIHDGERPVTRSSVKTIHKNNID